MLKADQDPGRKRGSSFSEYLSLAEEWVKSTPTKQAELKEKKEKRDKKKEIGPAKVDLTQLLGDTMKSWVSLHPKRGEYDNCELLFSLLTF